METYCQIALGIIAAGWIVKIVFGVLVAINEEA